MALPSARVVRTAGIEVARPAVPWATRLAEVEAGLGPRTRSLLGAIVGLWPVTAIVMLAGGLLWASVLSGSP